jgi:hypothetical protein
MAKQKINIFQCAIMLLLLMMNFSCEAPRKNPLDTHNPDGVWAELSGTAKTFGSSSNTIANVAVVWNNEKIAITDEQGLFLFSQIRAIDGWLRFSRENFKSDSVYISWAGRSNVSQDVILEPAPTIAGRVTSSVPSNPPIANVSVYWANDHIYTTTDQNGDYLLSDIKNDDGMLIFQKDGIRADSVQITWAGANAIVQNMQLHPMPSLQGHVKTTRVPPLAISGVKVTWKAAQQFTFTDAQGYYKFEEVSPDAGQLFFEKEGYKSFTENIVWSENSVVTTDVFLNANPRLDSLTLYSIVEHNYGPRIVEQLNVFAYLDDEEDDIMSVFLQCSPLDINAELSYNVQHKRFERSFSVIDLNINSMREVVGHDFSLMVLDDYDELYDLGAERIERVIIDEVEVDSPKNSDEVGNPVALQWQYFNPGFPFSYNIEVYTDDDFTQELVWHKEGVPSDSLSIIVDETLEPKEYVWMIWCVDEFSNRSRSKPGSFSVAE